MENKVDDLNDQTNTPREGSGSLLASARKKQNKSVDEIAAELNLSITQIKTIELDQSEGLPEPTYVRGYIRSYARLLGLDAEEVLKSYLNPNWQKSSSLDEMPKGIANADEVSNKSSFTLGKAITMLLVLVAVTAALWFSGVFSDLVNSSDNSGVVSTEPTLQADEPSSSITNVESTTSLAPSNTAPESSSDAGSTNESTTQPVTIAAQQQNSDGSNTQSASTESQVAQAVNEEPIEAHNLILNFVETCWVDIRDNNDKRLAYKSYYAGDELSVSNDERLNVFLGNADGVKATYNGEPFDMSSYREGVYAKFSLGKN